VSIHASSNHLSDAHQQKDHQIVDIDLNNLHFPSTNYKEGETQSTKGCQTYGEAASTVSITKDIGQLFELFFRGFANPLWFPYLDNDNLTLPCEFSFEIGCNDVHSIAIFNAFIHPLFCQQNSMEEGWFRVLLSTTSQT
jgi:hypothetical protein